MTDLVYHPEFLEHINNSLECPERLEVILSHLDDYNLIKPDQISPKELKNIHNPDYIDRIKGLSREERNFPDNNFKSNTFDIARLAASATHTALDLEGFALTRPPGHHAGKNSFEGFCYFNNIAYAVKKSNKRSLIVDIDVHHGNGTQSIFYDNTNVFYFSMHQDPRTLYPGTGFEKENNSTTKNVVLDPGTSDTRYLDILERELGKVDFDPEMIGISAGFDTYHKCPIANLDIRNSKTYFEIAQIIKQKYECPVFGCLEGGYKLPDLGENFKEFITGL